MWNSNVFYEKLLDGWERSETANGLPYYINHNTERTQWDHPLLTKMFEELVELDSIRYAAYRTAVKLRFLQKRMGFDQVSLHALQTVLDRRGLAGGVDTVVDCVDLYGILIDVFQVARSTNQSLTTEHQAELALNWLLNLYDVNRTGCIRLISVKTGIAAICSARLSEKYRYFFNQLADHTMHLTRKRLGFLLHDLIQIPEVMNESQPFGGLRVNAAVESCFSMVWGSVGATEDVFLSWLLREPQTLVWLPTMHRLAAAETVKHEAKCNVCKAFPIVGFRYKCLKCFNYDMCQQCFFTGRLSKSHKLKHPTQEYCITTTSKEDTKAFMKTIRNNLSKKHRNKRKLRYLPIYGSDTQSWDIEKQGLEDVPPVNMHALMVEKANKLSENLNSGRADAGRLKVVSPTDDVEGEEPKVKNGKHGLQIDELQRRELEDVIDHLENENRELMYEIERLHQRRYESNSKQTSEQGDWPSEEEADSYKGSTGRGGWGRGSPPQDPDQTNVRQEVLKAHNQQLEIQLQRLRYILSEHDAPPANRQPLGSVSSNVPVVGRRSKPLATVAMTPPRLLQQPPPYSRSSPRRSPAPPSLSHHLATGHTKNTLVTSFLQSQQHMFRTSPSTSANTPLAYDDHVDSALADLSRSSSRSVADYSRLAVDTSYGSATDGALSRTHFSLPSGGQSQYFPDEEAELGDLIDRLDQLYPADVSQSLSQSGSGYRESTMREMGRAANQIGEAFGQQTMESRGRESPRREMDCLSDSQDVDNSTYVTQVMQEVYVTS